MINEVKQDIASMFSLMERMNKHMTAFQAEFNKEQYLNEALYEISTNGHLEPRAMLVNQADQANKQRQVKITIGPLYDQDINKIIRQTTKFRRDANCQAVKLNGGGNGIAIVKIIPYDGRRGKKLPEVKPNASQTTSQNIANDNSQVINQQNNTPQQSPQQGVIGSNGKPIGAFASKLIDRLKAKNGGNSADSNALNEGSLRDRLLGRVANTAGNNSTATMPQSAVAPQQVDNNIQSDPSILKGTDSSIYTWLQNTYLAIVAILEKNPSYDRGAIEKLKDINRLYSKYCEEPTQEEKLYSSKTQEGIIKEVSDAIKRGDWQTNLPKIMQINPLDVESLVFGNVLSSKNQTIIASVCRDNGIDLTSPNYPTMVFAPGIWASKFNRRVVDNPKMRYPILAPSIDKRGTTVGKGTKGHYDQFGVANGGYRMVIAYDISDTEVLDPNDTTDYVNGLAGILNNFTGQLNPLAMQARSDWETAKSGSLTDVQKDVLQKASTDDGKAEIFNEALFHYFERTGIISDLKLKDIANSQNPVANYAYNVITFFNYVMDGMHYAKPEIRNPLVAAASFAVCYYSVGASEALSLSGYTQYNFSNSKLGESWDKAVETMINSIYQVITNISGYLSAVFTSETSNNTVQTQVPNVPAPSVAAFATKQVVNEENNDYSEIESLLEEFMR